MGAAGGIGQPLSMLLKLNVPADLLALYDVSPAAPGVAADVSHVDTKGKVRGNQILVLRGVATRETNAMYALH